MNETSAVTQSRETLARQHFLHVQEMRTTALLSLLSLWTEMTAVRAGRLITAAATGSELVSTAGSSCEPLGEGGQRARTGPGDSAVNGDFLPIFDFISLPECGGWGSHFYGTSGSVASCMYPAAENIPLRSIDIIRCAAATYHLCVLITELRRQLQHSL